MIQLAPSQHPEKESKQFGILALVFGVLGLLLWFLGLVAIAFGMRGAILASRAHDKKYLTLSIASIVLGLVAVVYYFVAR